MERCETDTQPDPEFAELLQRFCGRTVASVWFSDYSVLYLEFGEVIDSRPNHPKHEQAIFAGYDWSLRLGDGVVVDRLDRDDHLVENQLMGQSVLSISLTIDNELLVAFASGSRLESRSDTGEPPGWDVREGLRCAWIKENRCHVEG